MSNSQQYMQDGSPAIDAETGNFELVHESEEYHDYEPLGPSDTIRGWYRVTLNTQTPGNDYAITLDEREVRLTREDARRMIAGEWFPPLPVESQA